MNCKFYFSNLKWELLLTKKKYFRPSRIQINKDEVLQDKFVAWPFHFPSKPQLSTLSASTFHLYIYWCIIDLTRKKIFSIWLNFTALALRWRAPTGKLLMANWPIRNQSAGFIFCHVISHLMMTLAHVFRRLINFLAVVVKTGRFVKG